ncbi:class I SAM-dependent methyltransferase, partial [Kibdelosporangium lantanae]
MVAVEPTAELREIGQRLHPHASIEWIDDALPDLRMARGTFDLILLSAVWMHLDAAERAVAMARISRLLASEGRVILSLRHGPVPPGRRMFDV